MNSDSAFENILVVGLGLIGGSVLQTLKSQSYPGNTYGIDSNSSAISKAKEMGLILNKDQNIETDLQNVLVIFSVPTLSITKAIDDLNLLTEDVLYTDTCSVKSSVLKDLNTRDAKFLNKFILSHPIAGSEKSGVTASNAELFVDHRVILTPVESTADSHLERTTKLWQSVGALVSSMSVKEHDQVLAATSHLPHFLAYSLVDTLAAMTKKQIYFAMLLVAFVILLALLQATPLCGEILP